MQTYRLNLLVILLNTKETNPVALSQGSQKTKSIINNLADQIFSKLQRQGLLVALDKTPIVFLYLRHNLRRGAAQLESFKIASNDKS